MEGLKAAQPDMRDNVTQGLALSFGGGLMLWSAFNQVNNTFWAFFLTDVCGMSAGLMGTLKTIASIGEWFLVFVCAIIIEKTRPRWGQYRSWFVIAAPGAAFFWLMTFVNPPLSMTGKTVWMMFMYLMGSIFVSLFMIAATSIVPVIGKTDRGRRLLASRKAQGNMLVKVFFGLFALPVILFFNGGNANEAFGYFMLCLILGAGMVASFVYLFRRIKNDDPTVPECRAAYEQKKAAKKAGIKIEKEKEIKIKKLPFTKILYYWVTNIPAIVLWIAENTRFIAQMTITGMLMYFFTYVFQDKAFVAITLTAANATGLAGTFIAEQFARFAGRRVTYITGIAISAVAMFAGWFVGLSSPYAFIVCICICYLGMNFMNGILLAIQSDAISYGEWKHGDTAKAFIMGTFQWTPKIGMIIASALYGFGLASVGYTAGVAATPELAQAMINIICLIPGVCFAVAFVLMLIGYPLSKAKMTEILAELKNREEAKKAASQAAAMSPQNT